MNYISIESEKFDLIIDCLKSLVQFLNMLNGLPIKKFKKIEGKKYVSAVNDLISYCESLRNNC